jgi:hypothetical protein
MAGAVSPDCHGGDACVRVENMDPAKLDQGIRLGWHRMCCSDEPQGDPDTSTGDELAHRAGAVVRALYPTEPFSDAAGELNPAEHEIVEHALSDPEICRWSAYCQAAEQAVLQALDADGKSGQEGTLNAANEATPGAWKRVQVVRNYSRMLVRTRCGLSVDLIVDLREAVGIDDLPSIEEVDEAIRQTEAKCEFADARWDRMRLERLAAHNARQVEHRRVNGRWQRRPTVAEFALTRLPAARARERRAAIAVALPRHTCIEGPFPRTHARARARGAGRPGHRRVARASAPPGDEASEGEPARGRRSNDKAAVRA